MNPIHAGQPPALAELGEAIRAAARREGLHPRTGRIYVGWARRYVLHHDCRHPAELGLDAPRAFLAGLAQHANLSASTLRQAVMALRFLHEQVLGIRRPAQAWSAIRARAGRRRLAQTADEAEAATLIARLRGQARMIALLQFGSGLRLREALGLRVGDVAGEAVTIGGRTVAILPEVAAHLQRLASARRVAGGGPSSPLFLSRKRAPGGHPRPPDERVIQRAYRATGTGVTPRSLRLACEARLIAGGANLRLVQHLMGHRQVATVVDHARSAVAAAQASPLDDLAAADPPLRA